MKKKRRNFKDCSLQRSWHFQCLCRLLRLSEMSAEFGSTPAQGSAEAAGTSAPAEAEKNNGLSTESSAEPNESKDDSAKHEEARTEENSTTETSASDSSESSTNSQTEPEKTQVQTQAKEDSQKNLTQETWTTTASDGTQITVSGKLPSGGSVSAVPTSAFIKGQTTLLAFDITFAMPVEQNGSRPARQLP